MKINIANFNGVRPRMSGNNLQATEAQTAENCKLLSGALRPWLRSSVGTSYGPVGAVASLYYYGSQWLYWATDTDVVPSPVAEDLYDRLYLAGSWAKPQMATSSDDSTDAFGRPVLATRNLGIPTPTLAPTVTSTGGSGDQVTRVYAYTFLSPYGEEGPPSPPSEAVTGYINGTWELGAMDAAAPAGYTHILKENIYRSVPSSTTTKYQFLAEQTISATYSDTVDSGDEGDEMVSQTWIAPPDDLHGLVALPGGILAGFVGNAVYFSEPFQPHAWPAGYSQSCDHEIIGLGVLGQTCVVLTTAYPYMIYCPDPAQSTMDRADDLMPCTSKQSIVSSPFGVYFATQEGLGLINTAGPSNATQALMRRKEWDVFNPSAIKGFWTNGRYIGFHSGGGFVFEPGELTELTTIGTTLDAGRVLESEDQLYFGYINNGVLEIATWEGAESGFQTANWKSKIFLTAEPVNMAAARITAEYPAGATDPDDLWALIEAEEATQLLKRGEGAIHGAPIHTYPIHGDIMDQLESDYETKEYVTFKLWADGVLVYSDNIVTSLPIPLPAGYTARKFELEVSTNVEVKEIATATSMAEIMT